MKYGHADVPTQENMYMGTWSFFVSTNNSFPQIHRPFNKSARQPHRPRRRRIDRPALQPHPCRAGAYVYEYNVSLSGTPIPLPQGVAEVVSTEHHAHRQRGKYRTDCTRPPRHLYHRWIVHISSTRGNSPYHCPRKIFIIRIHFRRCPSPLLAAEPIPVAALHTRPRKLKRFRSRLLRAIEYDDGIETTTKVTNIKYCCILEQETVKAVIQTYVTVLYRHSIICTCSTERSAAAVWPRVGSKCTRFE